MEHLEPTTIVSKMAVKKPHVDGTPQSIESCIYFMKREDHHQYEKPYALRFVAETHFPPTNFVLQPHERIQINNMRGYLSDFSIEENGFAILKLPRRVPYEHHFDEVKIQGYFRQLEDLLQHHLGAQSVHVFRHSVRKRHPQFPLSTGASYSYDQPTSVAHIDTTPEFTSQEVNNRQGSAAEQLLKGRVQWMNIWKPLRGPINDWPLAVCDTQSVDPARDYEEADLLFENHIAENFQVHHHPDQRWYYLSDHDDDELIVFKQSDSDPTASPGVVHSSFFNPFAGPDEPPRESIEARALVFYGP